MKTQRIRLVSVTDHDSTTKADGSARSEKSLNKIGLAISQLFQSDKKSSLLSRGTVSSFVKQNKANSGVELTLGKNRFAYMTIDKFIYSEDEDGNRTISDKKTPEFVEFEKFMAQCEAENEEPAGVSLDSIFSGFSSEENRITYTELTQDELIAELDLKANISVEELEKVAKEYGIRPVKLGGVTFVTSDGSNVWRRSELTASSDEDRILEKDEVNISEVASANAFVAEEPKE